MKTLMVPTMAVFAVLWASAHPAAAQVPTQLQDAPSYSLKTSCTALLTSVSEETRTLTAESQPFAPTTLGFSDSVVKLELGPYTLMLQMFTNQPFGSPAMEPTLWMIVYKGNPIQGQVSEVRLQGLELEDRAFDRPLTLYGADFLDFEDHGLKVSRADYHCSLTKVH